MIAVAIIGILAMVAFPSYQEYVRRGARAEARAAIQNIAQLQERYFTDRGVYLAVTSGTQNNTWLNWSGASWAARKYNIGVALNSGTNAGGTANSCAYFITATPANGFSDPKCGNLTLCNDGTRGSTAGTVADCWK